MYICYGLGYRKIHYNIYEVFLWHNYRFSNSKSSKVNISLCKLELFRIEYNFIFSQITLNSQSYACNGQPTSHLIKHCRKRICPSRYVNYNLIIPARIWISTSQIILWYHFVVVPSIWSKEFCEMMIFGSKWYWISFPCVSHTFLSVCRKFTYLNEWTLYTMSFSYTTLIQRWEVKKYSMSTISFSNHNHTMYPKRRNTNWNLTKYT